MSMAGQGRFPRAPVDIKGLFAHSPTSMRSAGTSMLTNAGLLPYLLTSS